MTLTPSSSATAAFAQLDVHYLMRPEGRLGYRLTGDGPLVVCVPGMGEIAASYRYTVPALRDAGFRVAVMDLRGHGESDATFSAYDDAAAGTDILALIAHLGGPAIVLGNSMAAGAGVWAAAEQPAAVSGLGLLGPFVRNAPTNPVAAALFRVLMLRPWARGAWLAYLPQLSPGRKPADFAEHRDAIRTAMKRPGATAAFARTTRTDHAVAEERLPRVTAPTLVVMGTADPDFSDARAEAAWIGEQLRAEVVLVEGAGHYPQAEEPDQVNAALVSFCRTVARA
ncbi:alpha/beta hydrolase [Microbacterium sp. VKM Ac-2870]|uniref:alpha/beta fold hydrolase n=1 Tax=Microbacterium sp. VKM Ac-2870 TaxID=2783825 RepID=UPI00188AC2E7|nr:alpha/beta hydrolase [Microbacterium sp. VKM Ac-2870]MBF4563099.1 alpha/beta hydrolase [Microbacterium sp. VKM Ac-2870]